MNPSLSPCIQIRVYEGSQNANLEIRTVCQACWRSTQGHLSVEDVYRDWKDHNCLVFDRSGK